MVLLRVKPDEVGHPLGQRSATFNIKRATLAPPTKQREKKPQAGNGVGECMDQ